MYCRMLEDSWLESHLFCYSPAHLPPNYTFLCIQLFWQFLWHFCSRRIRFIKLFSQFFTQSCESRVPPIYPGVESKATDRPRRASPLNRYLSQMWMVALRTGLSHLWYMYSFFVDGASCSHHTDGSRINMVLEWIRSIHWWSAVKCSYISRWFKQKC